ncbi:GPI ethanolamine phosphate transferase 3 isoform X3 [Rhodamnia argentea]|uniref:GPI ethanolamine phosphate transferase 3 isoform X3 n=1 Tax=Rhodamnia argentea TaxID=178133 RepID=A0A8B8PQ11_9MYRT|nr:GPI ethanolamine phosphate transferase 3 isoform X3 [Rhodamnia argentea]
MKWRVTWVFWAIMALHVAAVLIFTRGFLLTRTELPFHSSCSDVSDSPCFSRSGAAGSNGTGGSERCWTKPAVDRVVIIVLDALRFDFVAPSAFFKGIVVSTFNFFSLIETKPWMDRLPVLQKLAFKEGSSAKIFKAIADPPTTSLQRLKGLTTGGLPTFVDVGNSFGAPAITEDNLINQLIRNGKRVLMMGDDTWVQLFPHHFKRSYPFPSFNVKDLHTVDNGCIDNLLPSLYQEDWEVLIAHFLGVDHAGHIFGVDSLPMIEKLEQYNTVLENVISVLESQSGPGGLHENTFLLVLGDHGQTLNGDHGGGSAEEVETSIFAMSFKKPLSAIPAELGISCEYASDERFCISSIEQLDFAVTVSALLGIPFPFGSIGRVNPELYALAAGTWNMEKLKSDNPEYHFKSAEWLHNYANVLCINAWQVKRYIDIYSASSLIGFSSDDLLHVANLYDEAEAIFARKRDNFSSKSELSRLSTLKSQIDAYLKFLGSVAELARSKWTEFNLTFMGIGLGMMLLSLLVHVLAIKMVNELHNGSFNPIGSSGISFGLIFAFFIVAIRACSLLSNSYILEEGKVANFLLATAGVAKFRYSIMKRKRIFEAGLFLILICLLRFTIEIGLSKQAATSAFLHSSTSWMIGIDFNHPVLVYILQLLPMLALIGLAHLLHKSTADGCSQRICRFVVMGTIASYVLIVVYWASESNMLGLALINTARNVIPRIIYAIGIGQMLLLAFGQLFNGSKVVDHRSLFSKTVSMLSAWSPTVIILSGRQGPLIALASIVGGFCIVMLQNIEEESDGTAKPLVVNPLSVMEWSLLALSMFFCTGHWCAFDGLRYGAAFIGFDEFVLIRQAILLTIETFGFSHIIPVFGLPFLVLRHKLFAQKDLFVQLSLAYMMFGLIMAATVTVTILCVMIQRRHLMVWGLFAPKFVFDVAGLVLTDVLICLASLYYFCQPEDLKLETNTGGR